MPTKARTRIQATPLALRTTGIEVTPALSEHVHERLRRRLTKVASHVERLSVRFEDVNGPRNGVDTLCRIKVALKGLPSIVVAELASEPLEAFNRADHRVERAVRRAVGRSRTLHRPSVARRATRPPSEARAKRSRSASPPVRKSKPASVSRTRPSNKLRRRQTRRVTSPRARASRAIAKRQ